MTQQKLFEPGRHRRARGIRRGLPTLSTLSSAARRAPLVGVTIDGKHTIIIDLRRARAQLSADYGHLPGRLLRYYFAETVRQFDRNPWLDVFSNWDDYRSLPITAAMEAKLPPLPPISTEGASWLK